MSTHLLRRIGLIAAVLVIALVPDADAQGRRGGGGRRRAGGGGGGGGRGGAVFGTKKRAKGSIPSASLARGAPAPLPAPTPAAGAGAPKGAALAAGEKRFLDLVGEIDSALAADEARRAGMSTQQEGPVAVAPPAGVEPGSPQWRELERPIFLGIDHDRSGWLSYRELRDALDCDRLEFAQYDRDHDGRVTSREFMARYDEVVARTGAFLTPRPQSEAAAAEPRTADQLRVAFDSDSDGSLDEPELARLLIEYGRTDTTPKALFELTDQDGNQRLGGDELFQLSRLVSYSLALPTEARRTSPRQAAKSVVDLFGAVEARPSSVSSAAAPPRIAGPVPHFRRLDLDGDGFISLEDLRTLQGSSSLGARIATVVASLDADEDGRISEREFAAAIATPPRGGSRTR